MATKQKTARRILKVTIRREQDDSPDLSYLGEYSNLDDGNGIDREARGDMGRTEFRWFNPAMTGDETGNPESPEQDYQRFESYNRGDWWMIGIWVEAEIQLTGDLVQRIRSGGLWGIESDSGEEYLKTVEDEEFAQLAVELKAIGFTQKQIDAAFATI